MKIAQELSMLQHPLLRNCDHIQIESIIRRQKYLYEAKFMHIHNYLHFPKLQKQNCIKINIIVPHYSRISSISTASCELAEIMHNKFCSV